MQATISLAFLLLLSVSSGQGAITVSQFINDNNVLNYALTLENLEAALYVAGLNAFGTTDANYTAAGFPQGTAAAISLISSQETGHAATLSAVLGLRGWPAVPACTYNFASALTSVTQFVNTLSNVENLGTSAYIGASGGLTSAELLQIAAGIATVEARHTAILATITNTSFAAPFPNVQDPGLTPAQVLSQATAFIASCTSKQQAVLYGTNAQVTVVSSDPATYAFQNSATVRGNTTVLPEAGNFYATTPSGTAAAANDFAVLNYALTLEHLEAFFYANFSAAFTPAAIQATNANANASIIAQSIALIAQHEAAHVNYLKMVLGNSATNPCSYNFAPVGIAYGSTNFTQFLTAAAALENTGVSAYVGAIRLIVNPYVAAIAAGIATVEGRHASYIGDLRASNSAIYGASGSVTYNAAINTVNFADNPMSPQSVASFLTTNGVLFGCPTTNPPVYGLGSLSNPSLDFFQDNAGNPTAPFVTSGQTSSTVAGGGGGGNPGTTLPARTTTGASSVVAVSFAVLAVAVALF